MFPSPSQFFQMQSLIPKWAKKSNRSENKRKRERREKNTFSVEKPWNKKTNINFSLRYEKTFFFTKTTQSEKQYLFLIVLLRTQKNC